MTRSASPQDIRQEIVPAGIPSLISARLSIAAALLTGVLILAFLAVSHRMENRLAKELSRQHADALASALRYQLLDKMSLGSKAEFNEVLGILASRHEVRARVRRPDGSTAFSWNAAELGAGAAGTYEAQGIAVSSTPLLARGPCAKCHEPEGKLIGTLEIGVPVAWLQARASRELRRLALAGAVAVAVLLFAAMLGFRHVSRRLGRLSASMEAARGGDFSVRLPADPRDEIGRVAASFNHLLAALHASKKSEERSHRRELLHLKQLATTGELAAGAAHEIKNPLGAVNATLESLAQDEKDQEKRALLLRVHEKLKDMHAVMLGLLEFARPRAPLLEAMDAQSCVDGVLATMEHRIRKQGVVLRRQHATAAPEVLADERLLGQVLINLLLNALEARDEDLELDVGTDVIGNNGNRQVRIWVRDNGPGIPPRDQAHVFQPFFSTKRKGSGLGLAIARDIVLRHNGVLSFDSRPGAGTCFCVFLPVPPADFASGGACP